MSEKNELVVVAGADGFIGGSLVADLRRQGYTCRTLAVKLRDESFHTFGGQQIGRAHV